jgi:hypothetical protein
VDAAQSVIATFAGIGGMKVFANGLRFEPAAARTLALMYGPAFGRAPLPSEAAAANDAGGLLFWANQFLGGPGANPAFVDRVNGIGEFFIRSNEFAAQVAAQFGAGATVDDLSDAQYINLIYGNLLNRAANAEEIGFWSGRIAEFGRGSVLADIAFSEEFQSLMPPELVAGVDSYIATIFASPDSLTPDPTEAGNASIETIARNWLDQM